MNTRNRALLLLMTVLVMSFLSVLPVLGQDLIAESTAEPSGTDTTVTTTTTTTGIAVEDIGLTLSWVLAFVVIWQAAGVTYSVTVEKTIKPMIYSVFTEDAPLRRGILITAVILGAFTVVASGGVNLFVDAPFGLFTNAAPVFMTVLNSIFVAAAAFISHEWWDAIVGWLTKFKAASEIFTAQSSDTTLQPRAASGRFTRDKDVT